MKTVNTFFGIFCCLLFAAVGTVDVSDCGSELGSFSNVTVSGCPESEPVCILKRNTVATIDVTFKTRKAIQRVNAVIHGVIDGIPMPFPLPHPNACKSSGLTCPLKRGRQYDYTATFPVHKSYPQVSVDVKLELKNENNEDIVCVLIPAEIRASNNMPEENDVISVHMVKFPGSQAAIVFHEI